MTLKAQTIADLSTFINVDEFADVVDIDGEPVACVIDNAGAPGPGQNEGVSFLEFTLYTKASSFYKVPVVGQQLTIDGQRAIVTNVDIRELLTIRLQWFDS